MLDDGGYCRNVDAERLGQLLSRLRSGPIDEVPDFNTQVIHINTLAPMLPRSGCRRYKGLRRPLIGRHAKNLQEISFGDEIDGRVMFLQVRFKYL